MITEYRDDTHEYFIDGKRVPSVTEILAPLSEFSHVDPDVMRRASNFGKAVHTMCELYWTGTLDESTVDEGLQGCLDAVKKWERDKGGLPDYDVLIDIKSREFDPAKDPLQLAGYDLLWRGCGRPVGSFYEHKFFAKRLKLAGTPDILIAGEDITELRLRYVLTLRQDGTYAYVNARRKQDDAMFKYMLRNWHMQYDFQAKLNGWRASK